MPCIDENAALQYVEGLLPEQETAAIDRHVASCQECRRLLADAGIAALDESMVEATDALSAAPTKEIADPEPVAKPPPAAGSRIGALLAGRYEVARLIGKGGMGAVYEAVDRQAPSAMRVAIKFLTADAAEHATAISRLEREARVASRLRHPNVVEVFDFAYADDGAAFIVMELLDGEPLLTRLRREANPLPLSLTTEIVRQTSAALEAAHQEGIVHRDLTPGNIILDPLPDGAVRVKVTDFGISKVLDAQSALTADLSVMGSPRYMAPEQARGASAEVDRRADIFSLGAIIFEMLCGVPPFAAESVPATLFKVVYEPPQEPDTWRQLPRMLQEVVLRALSKDPAGRQDSMGQLWHELATALRETGLYQVKERPETTLDNVAPAAAAIERMRQRKRQRWLLGGAVALLFTAVAVLIGLYGGESVEGPADEPPTRTAAVAAAASPAAAAAPAAGETRDAEAPSSTTSPPTETASQADASAPPVAHEVVSLVTPRRATRSQATRNQAARDERRHRPRHRATAPAKKKRRSRAHVPRPAAPPRPKGSGSLTIQSHDAKGGHLWADAYLDGKKVGQTALTLSDLPAGRHLVELRRAGYRSVVRTVRIKAGVRTRLQLELKATDER